MMNDIDALMGALRHVGAGRPIAADPAFAARLEASARRHAALAAVRSAGAGLAVAAAMVLANPFPASGPRSAGPLLTAPGGAIL